MEHCPKTRFFLGKFNAMTINFGNFANFIVRNFVVIWEAPKKKSPWWTLRIFFLIFFSVWGWGKGRGV